MDKVIKREYIDLAKYRIETAKNSLNSANTLFAIKDYQGATNRAYYAIFYAILAVFALEHKSFKKHKDAIANFNKDYIHVGVFQKEFGKRISIAERLRNLSDYDNFYIAKKEEASKQILTAKDLIEAVEPYCLKQIDKRGESDDENIVFGM